MRTIFGFVSGAAQTGTAPARRRARALRRRNIASLHGDGNRLAETPV
jgi:hypothetical protein